MSVIRKIRRLTRNLRDALLYGYMKATQCFWYWPDNAGIILAYHQVTSKRFEQQLKWLNKRYKPLKLNDFIKCLNAGTLPPMAFAVTFDDGYKHIYDELAEIAAKYNTPLTIYTVAESSEKREFWFARYLNLLNLDSKFVAGKLPPRHKLADMDFEDRLRLLDSIEAMAPRKKKKIRIMSPYEIEQISHLPHIEIGGHTVNHRFLSRLNECDATDEISEGNRYLESITGIPVRHFAYPFGDYSGETISIIKRLGLLSAVTGEYGCNRPESFNLYRLKRVKGGNMSLFSFVVGASGLGKSLAILSDRLGLTKANRCV